jgi:hypothetical protein
MRMAQEIGFLAHPLDQRLLILAGFLRRAPCVPQRRDLAHFGFQSAECIKQRAVLGRIDQSAVVMLAVNFDQSRAERAQNVHADRLIVDEGAGAAIGQLQAAQYEIAVIGEIVAGQNGASRMIARQIEHRRHLALRCAGAHKARIAATAKRQS